MKTSFAVLFWLEIVFDCEILILYSYCSLVIHLAAEKFY